MKLKSIIVLLVLVGAVGAYVLLSSKRSQQPAAAQTMVFQFQPADITAVTASHKGRRLALCRTGADQWTIEEPMRWPALPARLEPLLKALAGLQYRFDPTQADAEDFEWAKYGLEAPQLTLSVTAGDATHKIAVGTIEGESFSRRAYVRIDEEKRVLQVPADVYDQCTGLMRDNAASLRQRAFFLSTEHKEKAEKGEGAKIVRRLDADAITLASKEGTFSLAKKGDAWRLTLPTEPKKDSPDPDKLNALLEAVPTLGVEKFRTDSPTETELKRYGLQEGMAAVRVTVVRGGREATMEIGGPSRVSSYTVTKTKPSPQMPGRPPMPPQQEHLTVKEQYHYARLSGYPGVFEVKTIEYEDKRITPGDLRTKGAKFAELLVKPDDVRDTQLLRFGRGGEEPAELAFEEKDDKEKKEADETPRALADEITVASKDGAFTLKRDGKKWSLTAPMKDRPDPDKLKDIFEALPSMAVAGYVAGKPRAEDLKEYGLDEPERQVTIASGGRKITVHIGRASRQDSYTVKKTRPVPPQMRGRMPPQEEQIEIKEQYYYARMPEYPGVFEIKTATYGDDWRITQDDLHGKASKLAKLFIKPDEARDKKVARFDRWDVNHVTLAYQDNKLELNKKDYNWHVVRAAQEKGKTTTISADSTAVNDLLDKTKDLEGKEFLAGGDLKKLGLDKPAGTLAISTEKEETVEGTDEKKKTKKTHPLLIGQKAPDAKVVYLKLDGDERIVGVDPDYLDIVKKGWINYRDKKVLDFQKDELLTLEVKKADDHFVVRKDEDGYKLTQPGTGPADKDKVDGIVDKLTGLKAEKFIAEKASDDDLKKYGLKDKPYIRAVLTLKPKKEEDKKDDKDKEKKEGDKAKKKDEKKEPEKKERVYTLLVGKPTESDKDKRYACLDDGRLVFTIAKDPVEKLETKTVALLPKKLWDFARGDVQSIAIEQAKQQLRLKKAADQWRIAEPADAAAGASETDELLGKLVGLECERYVVLRAADLAKYGLAKPFLTVTLGVKGQAAKEKDAFQTYVLKIGTPEAKDKKSRFAMRAGTGASEAVFVLSEGLVERLTKDHLAYLDRRIVRVDRDEMASYQSTRGGQKFELSKQGNKWSVAKPDKIEPDSALLNQLLDALAEVKAKNYVALGKPDDAKYGFDKPYLTATLTTSNQPPEAPKPKEPPKKEADDKKKAEKKDDKPAEKKPDAGKKDDKAAKAPPKKAESKTITVVVGKTTAADSKDRYATVRGSKAIVVLSAETVAKLAWNHLDLLNREVVSIETDKVGRIESSRGGLKLEKPDDEWTITAPKKLKADQDAVKALLDGISPLEAEAYAAYKAKDLKPFGLDKPFATVRFILKEEKEDKDKKKEKKGEARAKDHVVLVGSPAADHQGSRYACLEKQTTVFVLSKALTEKLAGDSLAFRDRQVLDLDAGDVERVLVARRKSPTPAVFARDDDEWNLVEPVKGDVETSDLKDMVGDVAKLKVSRFVAEGVTDLKQYGLAPKPFAEVTLQLKPEEQEGKPKPAVRHTLQIGSPAAKDSDDRTATLKGSGLVFVLDKGAVESLTKEYRKREVLGWLDASNVKELTLTQDGKTLHLTKAGDDWKLKGDDKTTIDKDKVQETLDALSGLKTSRYVQDTSDNLALFGLKSPELTIQAKTDDKERTLHLGGKADAEGKERYARVPDKDKPGVFLLGGDDLKKLFRKARDFRGK